MEFKSENGKLSKVQEAYIENLNNNFISPAFVINDYDDFKLCLSGLEDYLIISKKWLSPIRVDEDFSTDI